MWHQRIRCRKLLLLLQIPLLLLPVFHNTVGIGLLLRPCSMIQALKMRVMRVAECMGLLWGYLMQMGFDPF